ncbi:MAG: hypothetical protein QOF83_296 [Solirubrobacteraceae bacterium]|nr:hypothetical protein [Solirubrobacteraceae bacterium]
MTKGARLFAIIASILTIGLLSAFVAGAGAKTTKGKKDSGTSYAAVVRTVGSKEYVAGYTLDKLFGHAATTYVTTLTSGKTGTVKVTGKPVTLYTAKGTLSGTGTATLNLATGAITGGKLVLTKGTGGLKGHSFKGTFTGTSNIAMGLFTFHYTGIYS